MSVDTAEQPLGTSRITQRRSSASEILQSRLAAAARLRRPTTSAPCGALTGSALILSVALAVALPLASTFYGQPSQLLAHVGWLALFGAYAAYTETLRMRPLAKEVGTLRARCAQLASARRASGLRRLQREVGGAPAAARSESGVSALLSLPTATFSWSAPASPISFIPKLSDSTPCHSKGSRPLVSAKPSLEAWCRVDCTGKGSVIEAD
eukprot:jgi/Tetstr1/438841/TSEL_027350.t1